MNNISILLLWEILGFLFVYFLLPAICTVYYYLVLPVVWRTVSHVLLVVFRAGCCNMSAVIFWMSCILNTYDNKWNQILHFRYLIQVIFCCVFLIQSNIEINHHQHNLIYQKISKNCFMVYSSESPSTISVCTETSTSTSGTKDEDTIK